MKNVIVTGAAGFTGANLTETLVKHGYHVYGVVRPSSSHNNRIANLENVDLVPLDTNEIGRLVDYIHEECQAFIHLSWQGTRDDMDSQFTNIENALDAVKVAARLGCKEFIGIGSQAEYGVKSHEICEDESLEPINAYGAAKVAAMHLTKTLAISLGLSWKWGRIFSLYGRYEPSGRMLPDLISNLKAGNEMNLSSCNQYWDYLDVRDASEAIIAILEKGNTGQVYHIANGDYKPLIDFVKILQMKYGPDVSIHYGADPSPYIQLMPSMDKLKKDTGWEPIYKFE